MENKRPRNLLSISLRFLERHLVVEIFDRESVIYEAERQAHPLLQLEGTDTALRMMAAVKKERLEGKLEGKLMLPDSGPVTNLSDNL